MASAGGLLREYEKKRNFRKTAEPKPKARKSIAKNKKKAAKPLFVVQEHHARRLHYDFRLELDGVLKSWAVPKGVSLDPKVKRLAVQTEDHPYDYARFTGRIPEGEYGAGQVYRWDIGTWTPVGDPHDGLRKGHLEFDLHGQKLRGRFILVRTGGKKSKAGPKSQWLLIKRTDASARAEREATGKAATARVVKDKAPVKLEFIPPQLAKLEERPPLSDEWVHEIKYDGYRTQAHIVGRGRAREVKLYTRNGLNWTKAYPTIAEALKKLNVQTAILDGEVVWIDEDGQQNFQKLQNSIKNGKGENHTFFVFDLLHLDGEDLRELPLLERKKRLQKLLAEVSEPIKYSEHYATPAADFFAATCKYGLEGMVSKRGDSAYFSGRGPQWVKVKCQKSDEFVIGGYTDAKGSRYGFGALLLGKYEDKGRHKDALRYVGRVGTGFDEYTLRSIKKQLEAAETAKSPFAINVPRGKDIHWVKPRLVAEVSFAEFTDEKILRAPVFHGLREDKSPSEINISHPDRVIYKEEGITKEQVVMYYQVVAEFMLAHLRDRPLALVRCQESSTDACFFQKHLPGEKEDIHIASEEELLQLIQFGALEIHTWNSRLPHKKKPDQFVIDFDPGPGVAWKEVIAAAFELKDMLDEMNLRSFLKVTGGKGLHVHVPIEPKATFANVKAFTKGIARQLVATNPDKYIAEMAKKKREGKIFVDYLRNGEGATAIAPYCLRARARSSVALPILWEELPGIESADQFTMAEALSHIAKREKDPWADYFLSGATG